jgi:plastocyanin
MNPPRAAIAALAAALALALAGCGSDDDGGGSNAGGSSSTASAGSGPVTIKNFLYRPEKVSVSAGDSISFTNEDSANHTATANDGSFDTGTLEQGDSKALTFEEPGTYAYICSFHPFMTGEVTVEG